MSVVQAPTLQSDSALAASLPLAVQFLGPQQAHGVIQPANTYVSDLATAWNESIPANPASIEASRNRVAALAPQLRTLGLSDDQILSLIIAVL